MTRRACLTGHDWRPDPVHLFGVCRWCGVVGEYPQPSQGYETINIDQTSDIPIRARARLSEPELMAVEGDEARPVRAQIGTEGVDEPEGGPEEIGPTPRWFIIVFSLFVLACGLCSVLGAIAYFAGWIG